jgi:L-lactate dehydrogenase complex protein LldG
MSPRRQGPTTARDTIMARIREALRVPAAPPHLHDSPAPASNGSRSLTVLPAESARPWLPDAGDTPAEQLAWFMERSEKLRAECHRVPDLPAAATIVVRMASERQWRRVACHDHPLVNEVAARLPCDTLRTDASIADGAGFDKAALESCDAGITSCEALVAQTGSILVSSRTCGGRALSILPHVHVVVATVEQLVGTLDDALRTVRRRHHDRLPSMLSLITGPSRTGDIERILVLGAHGPRELHVVVVG